MEIKEKIKKKGKKIKEKEKKKKGGIIFLLFPNFLQISAVPYQLYGRNILHDCWAKELQFTVS